MTACKCNFRTYMLGDGCEVPMPDDIERIAIARYRCVPLSLSEPLFGYKVVAGDGDRSLFIGSKEECYVIARKLTEAFLDGSHVACGQMKKYGDDREAAGYAAGVAASVQVAQKSGRADESTAQQIAQEIAALRGEVKP